MRNLLFLFIVIFNIENLYGSTPSNDQITKERENQSVVRNKKYDKDGKFELALTAGLLPYDSLLSGYLLGGRLDWHLSDHFGWQVLDFQVGFGSLSNYVKNLAKERGLSNVQVPQMKTVAGTNLIISPFYGKIRFFGGTVGYLDIYGVIGGGMAKMDVTQLSSSAIGVAATESVISSEWNPMFDIGIGIKLFFTDSVGMVLDLRDYVVHTPLYGKKSFTSNYTVFLGLNLFLPNF